MVQIVKVARRVYACRECGHEIETSTNHREDCYPVCEGKCRQYLRTGRGTAERELVLPLQTAHRFIRDVE